MNKHYSQADLIKRFASKPVKFAVPLKNGKPFNDSPKNKKGVLVK